MFQQSATTKACYEILRGVNGEISYSVICSKLKLPLETIRSSLNTARRALEKEQIAFAVIRGVGLKRLNDGETAQSSSRFVKQINRSAKRGTRRLQAVRNFNELSNADQLTATLNRTLFETVRSHTSLRATAVKAEASPVPNVVALTKAMK